MKICFAMTFCELDANLVMPSTDAILSLYPAAIVAINDSVTKLKQPPHAGHWTQRWMEQAMASGADVIIKLDPDTRALRAVTEFPTTDMFGQYTRLKWYTQEQGTLLMGGCIGFQASAIRKILDSGLLLDPKYGEKPYAQEDTRRIGTTVILQDPIVHDIAAKLGLSLSAWDGLDLMMHWEPARPFKADATFVHPWRTE